MEERNNGVLFPSPTVLFSSEPEKENSNRKKLRNEIFTSQLNLHFQLWSVMVSFLGKKLSCYPCHTCYQRNNDFAYKNKDPWKIRPGNSRTKKRFENSFLRNQVKDKSHLIKPIILNLPLLKSLFRKNFHEQKVYVLQNHNDQKCMKYVNLFSLTFFRFRVEHVSNPKLDL